MQYVLDHSEARFAVAEDQEQTDKLLNLKERCPKLELIIYNDPKGMRHYNQPFLKKFIDIQNLGASFEQDHPYYFEEEIQKGNRETPQSSAIPQEPQVIQRLRIAYTAGEAIGPEIFEFFRTLGVNLKQVYGTTKSSALVSLQRGDDIKSDTVGKPLPEVEIKISEKGEVMYRSPGVF